MRNNKSLKGESQSENREISSTAIIIVIALLLCAGIVIRSAFFPNRVSLKNSGQVQSMSQRDLSIHNQVDLISANFRCACGGCGEMQLIECECNMPRGAREEKQFMRQKLEEGLSVEQIIQLVDEKYGHRNI